MEHDGAAERSNKYGDSGYSRMNSTRSLTRKIYQMVSFDFIYDPVAPYYPANGRPSVDLVSMDIFMASSQNADLSRKFS